MPNLDWIPAELKKCVTYRDNKYVIGCSVFGCSAQRQSAGKGAILRKIDEGKLNSLLYCSTHGGKAIAPTQEEIKSWPSNHKRCTACLVVKPFKDFHKHAKCLFGYNVVCKNCRIPLSKKHYADRTFEQRMYDRAKRRSDSSGREFSIRVEDIQIPKLCPILGIKIVLRSNHPYAPSIDRIDSSRGYTPDNIQVVSRRANVLKNNMTPDESHKLSAWFELVEIG